MKKSLKYLLPLLISCFIWNSCNKSSTTNSATSGYVNVQATLTAYPSLNAVTGWCYIPQSPDGGIRGIILYRVSSEQFNAYERSCTYNTSTECAPLIVKNNFYIADTCKNCGSQFLLTTGGVSKGPATIQLTQYKTSFDGVNTITITN